MRAWIAALVFGLAGTVAQAATIGGQGTWESTLQARDVNGDGVADAYYDSVLDLTWLADANYVQTSGYTEGTFASFGWLYRAEAALFVSKLDVYGIDGWRLPKARQEVPAGIDPFFLEMTLMTGSYVDFIPEPSFSEIAHLHYVTLGNSASNPRNEGLFLNVQSDYTGADWCADPATALCGQYTPFSWDSGKQSIAAEDRPMSVWAVHDGDILAAPVPEPATYGLLGAGLALLAAYSRRRRA